MLGTLLSSPLNSLIAVLVFNLVLSTVCLKSKLRRFTKQITLSSSLFALIIGLFLCLSLDKTNGGFQFVAYAKIIPQYNISFALGVDGFSTIFIMLTLFVFPICILSA